MSIVAPASVREPAAPSRQSLLALSWLNFFLACVQAAFGPIAAAYLAAQHWTTQDIGFVLSIDGIFSLISQVPGGELLDAVRAKRLLVGAGVVTVALSILILRLWPSSRSSHLPRRCRGLPAASSGWGWLLLRSDS